MYATDPISVRQLRSADLLVAEQSRSGRTPRSHRRGWFRRTVLDRIPSRRSPAPITAPEPTLASYHSLELFVGLDNRSLAQLAESFLLVDVDSGHSLGRQGESAPEFVVVLEGRIGVSLDGLPLVVLDPGSHFGALPLIDDGPTPYGRASFDVLGPGRVAIAGRLEFAQILETYPLVAGRIRAITDVRRAYLKGRADAASVGASATEDFPLHIADVR